MTDTPTPAQQMPAPCPFCRQEMVDMTEPHLHWIHPWRNSDFPDFCWLQGAVIHPGDGLTTWNRRAGQQSTQQSGGSGERPIAPSDIDKLAKMMWDEHFPGIQQPLADEGLYSRFALTALQLLRPQQSGGDAERECICPKCGVRHGGKMPATGFDIF